MCWFSSLVYIRDRHRMIFILFCLFRGEWLKIALRKQNSLTSINYHRYFWIKERRMRAEIGNTHNTQQYMWSKQEKIWKEAYRKGNEKAKHQSTFFIPAQISHSFFRSSFSFSVSVFSLTHAFFCSLISARHFLISWLFQIQYALMKATNEHSWYAFICA